MNKITCFLILTLASSIREACPSATIGGERKTVFNETCEVPTDEQEHSSLETIHMMLEHAIMGIPGYLVRCVPFSRTELQIVWNAMRTPVNDYCILIEESMESSYECFNNSNGSKNYLESYQSSKMLFFQSEYILLKTFSRCSTIYTALANVQQRVYVLQSSVWIFLLLFYVIIAIFSRVYNTSIIRVSFKIGKSLFWALTVTLLSLSYFSGHWFVFTTNLWNLLCFVDGR